MLWRLGPAARLSQGRSVMRKQRGKKGSLGRDFAPLYEAIMRADAVRTLPLSAFKLWTVAVALCKPWSNGAVPLTRSVLVKFGLANSQAVTQGLAILIERGLIVQTRKAISRRCALFGVSHLPLNQDAMTKVGAREPQDSRARGQSTSADCSSVHESARGQSTNGKNSALVDCSSVQNTPISPSFVDCSSVTSKNLPPARADFAHLPEHLHALVLRVQAHGGTLTASDHLRVRWWHGDPPAELAGELKIHARELYRHMSQPAVH
jgi:hypothetical protein